MNSEIQPLQQIPTNEKRPKKKPLPVKYKQLLVFGYWMLGNMKSDETISVDIYENMMRKLYMFDGTDLQREYLDNFIQLFPELSKQLKKDSQERNPKPPRKERKQRKKDNAEKKRPGRPRKEKKIVSSVASFDPITELIAQEMEVVEDSDSDEEEIEVKKFVFCNVLYLIDENNTIYDFTHHEEVGKWNTEKKCIDFFSEK